ATVGRGGSYRPPGGRYGINRVIRGLRAPQQAAERHGAGVARVGLLLPRQGLLPHPPRHWRGNRRGLPRRPDRGRRPLVLPQLPPLASTARRARASAARALPLRRAHWARLRPPARLGPAHAD